MKPLHNHEENWGRPGITVHPPEVIIQFTPVDGGAPHAAASSQPRHSQAVTRLASAMPLRGASRSRMPRSRANTQPETAVYQQEAVRCGISSNRWRAAAGSVIWKKKLNWRQFSDLNWKN